jgi:hypothetical protein
MNALRRRILRLATLLGALTVVFACNAPFIPVPPPGATFTSELTDDGMGGQKTVWITHGLPSTHAALARYSVVNQATGEGVVATAAADGTFTADPIDGVENDHIELYYRTPQGDYSESICLLLTETVGSNGSAPETSCLP